ncbi:hypothetical protein JCM10908_002545 [Rhodotorula pacifica]|uniref:uncharacterized protein n=1 Tax=Rhodotorula pacifica TaxID=1495444 RepID=UPI003176CC92
MTLTNTPLTTIEGVGEDGVVPFNIVLRWFRLLRGVEGLKGYVDSRLTMASRKQWPLAGEDGSVELYELVNLVGKPVLAFRTRDLVRVERDLRTTLRLSADRLAETLAAAQVYVVYNSQRKLLRFPDKGTFRKRLADDVAERALRRAGGTAQGSSEIRSDASTSREPTPSSQVPLPNSTVPAKGKKRTASTSVAEAPSAKAVASSARPAAVTASLATNTPGEQASSKISSSPPPMKTKRVRPALPGPSHSSPPSFGGASEAAASTSGTPTDKALAPARVTALSRPPPPAATPLVRAESYADAEKIAAAKHVAGRAFELETLRLAHEAAVQQGAGAFLALDVEAWEFDHDLLLEFGWSIVEYVKDEKTGRVSERRETQHVVVKENARRRNRKFAPDARDHFDFGRTITLPQQTIFHLLSGLFSALSANQPLFLVFHDPRMDLSALRRLGFDTTRDFQHDLRKLGSFHETSGGEHGVWIVDTQALFSGWLKRKSQIGLERACKEIDLPTKRLHNAGNDARYTLDLFEHMMDRAQSPAPASTLVKFLDERAAAEAAARQKRLNMGAQILKEKFEQKALPRTETASSSSRP